MKFKLLCSLLLFTLLFIGCKKPDYNNVLLITVDGLRADAPGCYGGMAKTPALDQLAREGFRFTNLATPVPLTLPAHASLLTGMNPPEHGLRIDHYGRLPPAIATVTESFAAAGFTTVAILSSPYLATTHGLERAFEIYDAPTPTAEHAVLLQAPLAYTPTAIGAADGTQPPLFPDHNDTATAARFRSWLSSRQSAAPWFAWVQFSGTALPRCDDANTPYAANDTNAYLRAVAAVDAAIGTVLDGLRSSASATKTVILVTASSGESLGENNEYGHGLLLRATTRRVPGLLRLPDGRGAGTRIPFSTSLVQVAPTLLDLAKVAPCKTQTANWAYLRWIEPITPVPLPEAPGKFFYPSRSDSLAPLLYGYVSGVDTAVFSETQYPYALFRWQPLTALQIGNWIYIKNEPPELYDLDNDPYEKSNLAPSLPDSVTRLDIKLERLSEAMAFRPPIDTTSSNDVWQAMNAWGSTGHSESRLRTQYTRSHIGLARQTQMTEHPAPDAALATLAARLYPLLATTNRSPQTLALIDACIAQSPTTARFYVWRANLNSADTNALPQVIADLTQAAANDPNDAEIIAHLGKAYFEIGDYENALISLRETAKRDPKNTLANAMLPNVLMLTANEASQRNDPAEALRAVNDLLAFQPTLENRMWRVRLLIARQRNTQARQELRNILYANPDYFPARDLLDRLR